jgi:hypothetical protein
MRLHLANSTSLLIVQKLSFVQLAGDALWIESETFQSGSYPEPRNGRLPLVIPDAAQRAGRTVLGWR